MSRSPLARIATATGLTAVAAAAGVMLAPSALAETVEATLPAVTATPGTIAPGDTFTISGTGCVSEDPDNPVALAFGGIGYGEMGDGKETTPDDEGNWSVKLTFPADVPAGTYPIGGGCEFYNGDIAFNADAELVVAAATAPKPAETKATVTKSADGVTTVTASAGQSLTPDAAAAPGEVRMLQLTGYNPGEKVTLVLHSTPQTIGIFTADAQGVVNARFVVPAGTPAGEHTLKVTRADGSVISYPVTVAAAGKKLASTGADVTLPLVGGMALVLVGGGALVAARRRTPGAAQL